MKKKEFQVKPSFPKEGIEIEITVKVKLLHDFGRYSDGKMMMTIERGDVSDEHGKNIGWIAPALGGGMGISIGDRLWALNSLQLWEAVNAAEKTKYLGLPTS